MNIHLTGFYEVIKLAKTINWTNISFKSKDGAKYIDKRYNNLLKKGYSPEQAQNMIYFELGVSAVMRESIETATAEECMMVGRLVRRVGKTECAHRKL